MQQHIITDTESETRITNPSPLSKYKRFSKKSLFQIRSQSDKSEKRSDSPASSVGGHSYSSNEKLYTSLFPPSHTSSLTYLNKDILPNDDSADNELLKGSQTATPTPQQCLSPAIPNASHTDFVDMQSFRSFLVRLRRDIKDLFEQIASKGDTHSTTENADTVSSTVSSTSTTNATLLSTTSNATETNKLLDHHLTLNTHCDESQGADQGNKICDTLDSANIVAKCAAFGALDSVDDVDVAAADAVKSMLLTCNNFHAFLTTYQGEEVNHEQVKALIQIHEPDPVIKKRNCLSFEGFASYLMDEVNYAYQPEMFETNEEGMNEPLSHYYIASSHNTYLTGHQLKGESSVESYSQVLLTGCRCVELDCWDGEDGFPVIYHGHTLTTKISFKKVVETINEKAFVASPYPVLLSLENHCSLQQQTKMAQIFVSIFGEKLVTKFLFESDYTDDPQLPSPNQLKYRILIKNKKLRVPLTPALNMRMRQANYGKASGKLNSYMSTDSTGSFEDNEDEEYDEEEEDDECMDESPSTSVMEQQPEYNVAKHALSRTESLSSDEQDGSPHSELKDAKSFRYSSPGSKSRSKNEEHIHENVSAHQAKIVRKSSSPIAPELSDLVNYLQAIKFRGFSNNISGGGISNLNMPSTSQSGPRKIINRRAMSSSNSNYASSDISSSSVSSPLPIEKLSTTCENEELLSLSPTPSSHTPSSHTPSSHNANLHSSMSNIPTNKRPTVSAPCYQVSSINENTAKKLCRKNPLSLIAHNESQIMRTYPAGMRIDSSNFNPVIFWAFGVQSVALNYQTVDSALHINTAMFEQNGQCGMVLKPAVMRDKWHMMYGRFNPWDKEFDGLHAINLFITVISGQHMSPNTENVSVQVGIEVIGIPVDCRREKTKIVQRNSLNPIWNDTFLFRVSFSDLAFLRFTVTDVGNNHVTAQRVVPFNCLRRGYRHLRLKGQQYQTLPLTTLFIYSDWEEEGMDVKKGPQDEPGTSLLRPNIKKIRQKIYSSVDLNRLDSREIIGTTPVRRRMFFLVVYGVVKDEPSSILKITQDSTVYDVIAQALKKAAKSDENPEEYVLIEDVQRGWEKKHFRSDRNAITQRILDPDERPLEAQARWKGNGRFILKKLADDPSTRAWMTTIRTTHNHKDRQRRQEDPSDDLNSAWNDEPEDSFLVCIYNVSATQPYTILKAPTSSSSQDVITQAIIKARRMDNPRNYVIIEELEEYITDGRDSFGNKSERKNKSTRIWRRILEDDENVFQAQAEWKTKGKFELKSRELITAADMTNISKVKVSKFHRGRGSFKKLHHSKSRLSRGELTMTSGSSKDSYGSKLREKSSSRQVHSEGDVSSDDSDDSKISFFISKLKRLSFRKLKVW